MLLKIRTVSKYPRFSGRFCFSYLSSLHDGQNCYNIQKCYPMRLTSHAPDRKWSQSYAFDKIFLKAHIEVLKKKKKESTSCHAFMLWSCHASSDKICTNKRIQLILSQKVEKTLFTDYYSQITVHGLLFTDTIHFEFCLFKGGCPLCLEQVFTSKFLLLSFFFKSSFLERVPCSEPFFERVPYFPTITIFLQSL